MLRQSAAGNGGPRRARADGREGKDECGLGPSGECPPARTGKAGHTAQQLGGTEGEADRRRRNKKDWFRMQGE